MSRCPFDFSLPPPISNALDRLIDAGQEAYIVGGVLRDALLGRPVPDWDITTSAPSGLIHELFKDTKNYCLKHGTVTLVLPETRVEITPYRAQARSLEADLAKRDFTVNAMAWDPVRQTLIDPWEGGVDLDRHIIRATGDPDSRFREDPIRLLRGIRLATELGFEIHPRTLAAMEADALLINHAATERVREELKKMLMSSHPSNGFRVMYNCGILAEVLPELCEGKGVEQDRSHHRYTVFDHTMETVDRISPVLHLRLAALFHDIAKPRVRHFERGKWRFLGHAQESADLAKRIMARLRFSRTLMEKVSHLIDNHMIGYSEEWGDGAVRRLIRRTGTETIGDLIILCKADLLAHGMDNGPIELLEDLERRLASILRKQQAVSLRDLALNGHDVMEILHLEPGPRVGKILDDLLETVTDDPRLNNPGDLMSLLKKGTPSGQ
jgi:tRNA nucleotidyltransferase (CCA-adding enzyme)